MSDATLKDWEKVENTSFLFLVKICVYILHSINILCIYYNKYNLYYDQ